MAEKPSSQQHVAAPRSRGDRFQPPTTATSMAMAHSELEREWRALLAAQQEEGDAGDIVAELVERVMDACAQAFAARERVPYSVRWARDAILRGTLWRFLKRDEGDADPDEDPEDKEPQPCPMDSCAQGAVPVRPSRSQVSSASVGAQDPPMVPKAGALPAQPPCPSRVPTIPAPEPSRSEDDAITLPLPKGQDPRSRPLAPRLNPQCPARPRGPCPPQGASEPPAQQELGGHLPWSLHRDMAGVRSHMAPPLPSRASLDPTWLEVPPRIPGVTYQGSSSHPGVPRLHPGRRPQRWIQPWVEMVEVSVEAKVPARAQGARGRSQGVGSVGRKQRQLPPAPQPPRPLPQALRSALAPGVTIRQGSSVMRGLCIPVPEEEEKGTRDLRPIRPTVPVPAIATGHLTGGSEC